MTPAQEELAYFHTLGKSLSIWADVETTLLLIVCSCLPAERETRSPFAAGYASIDGFRTKLNFADSVITNVLSDVEHIEDWKVQKDKLRSRSSMRNNLAHSRTFEFSKSKPGKRFALCPGWSPAIVVDAEKPPPGAIFLVDLIKIQIQFHATFVSLSNFYDRICNQQERFPKAFEEAAAPPKIRDVLKSLYAAAGLPPIKSAKERRKEASDANASASGVGNSS
jgi:hypothetical protein